MKKFLLSLVACSLVSAGAFAQKNLYFVPTKKAIQQERQNARQSQQRTVLDDYESSFEPINDYDHDTWADYRVNGSRDVDAYNRRGNGLLVATCDSAAVDSTIVEEAYEDDYSATQRIVRFHSPRGVLVASPYYTDYLYDLSYYDPYFYDVWVNPWYNPWYTPWYHGIGFSYGYGWHNGWYYGGWGWGNNPWYYSYWSSLYGWYNPWGYYYGWGYPGYIHHHGGGWGHDNDWAHRGSTRGGGRLGNNGIGRGETHLASRPSAGQLSKTYSRGGGRGTSSAYNRFSTNGSTTTTSGRGTSSTTSRYGTSTSRAAGNVNTHTRGNLSNGGASAGRSQGNATTSSRSSSSSSYSTPSRSYSNGSSSYSGSSSSHSYSGSSSSSFSGSRGGGSFGGGSRSGGGGGSRGGGRR